MPIQKSQVQYLVQNEILPGITWKDPTSGYDVTNVTVQERIDQLLPRIPFRALASAALEIPWVNDAQDDLFLSEGAVPPLGLGEANINIQTDTFSMSSIGATLRIPSGTMGRELDAEQIREFEQVLAQVLKRFLSVGVVYGGYTGGSGWKYPGVTTWDQSVAFTGMHQLCALGNGYEYPGGGLLSTLSLAEMNHFIHAFRGANQGHIDYLVMNLELREKYLNLWHASAQVPQYVEDPMTGKKCLAHDGIPILVNDYILTYQVGGSTDHPEKYFTSEDKDQTSMYAVVLGEDRQGMFGLHPESSGSQPIRVEQARMTEDENTILLRGSAEAGLAAKTTRSIGRWAGIDMTA